MTNLVWRGNWRFHTFWIPIRNRVSWFRNVLFYHVLPICSSILSAAFDNFQHFPSIISIKFSPPSFPITTKKQHPAPSQPVKHKNKNWWSLSKTRVPGNHHLARKKSFWRQFLVFYRCARGDGDRKTHVEFGWHAAWRLEVSVFFVGRGKGGGGLFLYRSC